MLPDSPVQGIGAGGDPVLARLCGEGDASPPAAAQGQAGSAPRSHRHSPAMAWRTKVLAAGCQSWRKSTWSWEQHCAWLL